MRTEFDCPDSATDACFAQSYISPWLFNLLFRVPLISVLPVKTDSPGLNFRQNPVQFTFEHVINQRAIVDINAFDYTTGQVTKNDPMRADPKPVVALQPLSQSPNVALFIG